MKKKIFILTVAVVLGFGMIVTPALALTNTTSTTSFTDFQQAQQARAASGNGMGKYFAGSMHGTVSSAFGLTDDELYALRVEGKSIAQIANEKGVAVEGLANTLTLAKIDQVNQLFTDGTITVAQKDYMISQAADRTTYNINKTTMGNQGNKGQNKGMRSNVDGSALQGQGRMNGGGAGLNINNQ